MFCRNCGSEIDPNASVCVKCGVAVGKCSSYCPNCGAATDPHASCCVNCGTALTPPVPQGEQKSKMAAGLLGIFLGGLGVHNFYLGNTGKALAQLLITLLTCGFGSFISGIWGLIEGIMILTGSIDTDGKGVPLKD